MAPAFFTLDRVPAVSRIIGLPAPVPPAVVRSVAGSLYRRLAFADPAGVDKAVVDRFTRFHVERGVIRDRIDYAKRLRDELEDPFDADAIKVPVTVIWGESDRLCVPSGAAQLAELLPHAKVTMLPGVGHTPQVEAPDVVVDAIARALRLALRRVDRFEEAREDRSPFVGAVEVEVVAGAGNLDRRAPWRAARSSRAAVASVTSPWPARTISTGHSIRSHWSQ